MKQSIEYYICDLLYQHDCVIVPGFGGFVGNRKSASIHPLSGVINPPTKELLFNRNLIQNDGLLATYIANLEGIDLSDTNIHIQKFVNKIENEINNKSVLKLNKIGTFNKGVEGNISFVQDKNQNYNLETFGMQSNFDSKKIDRTHYEDNKTIIKDLKQKYPYTSFVRAAAVLIPLIILSLIGITQDEKITNIYNQMANLNPFEGSINKTTNELYVEKENELNIVEIKEVPVIIEDKDLSIILEKKNTFYIIAGAFSIKENASNLCDKLRKWNYNSIILDEKNIMRVTYNSFNIREDALLALNEIRKDNPSAWLLTK